MPATEIRQQSVRGIDHIPDAALLVTADGDIQLYPNLR